LSTPLYDLTTKFAGNTSHAEGTSFIRTVLKNGKRLKSLFINIGRGKYGCIMSRWTNSVQNVSFRASHEYYARQVLLVNLITRLACT